MKKVLPFLKISLNDCLTYRGDIILYTLSGAVLPVTSLIVWINTSTGLTSYFIQYYFFLLIIGLWTSNWESYFISRGIRLGNISPHLIKPVPFIFSQIGNNLGEKVFKTLFLLPVLIGYILVFHPAVPDFSPFIWLVVLISTLMAAVISFIADFLLGISAFWLHDSLALREAYSITHMVFSGRFIPLSVLPLSAQLVSSFLPFRYSLSLPLEIVTGQLSGTRMILPLTFQLLFRPD